MATNAILYCGLTPIADLAKLSNNSWTLFWAHDTSSVAKTSEMDLSAKLLPLAAADVGLLLLAAVVVYVM